MNYDLEREIYMRRCNKIMVCMSFLFASALAGCSQKDIEIASNDSFQADQTDSIIHESVDISYYDNGYPYIHDILTNNTDKTVTETQYCMLAYDENSLPLKLHWNFLDSSAESSFENVVQSQENIIPGQTQDYRGGWSLCDGEIMEDFPKAGNSGVNQVTYVLFCLEQVVFEDGSVWNNPDYENWFDTYAGKEMETDQLQNYYPYVYQIVLD